MASAHCPLTCRGAACTCQSDTVTALAKELMRLENDRVTASICANDRFVLMLLALTAGGFSISWPAAGERSCTRSSESRSGFVSQERKSRQELWGSEGARAKKSQFLGGSWGVPGGQCLLGSQSQVSKCTSFSLHLTPPHQSVGERMAPKITWIAHTSRFFSTASGYSSQ